jgi:DMSO/TMAO reductase YedYZ molybdopterin-dependent catalytic subunit
VPSVRFVAPGLLEYKSLSQPFEKALIRTVSRRRILKWGGGSLALLVTACRGDDATTIDTGEIPGPEALSPITPISEFYVVAHFGMADVDSATWELKIISQGETLGTVDYALLESLVPREREHTLQCIESRPGWVRMSNGLFEGLPLPEVLDAAGIAWRVGASHLQLSCADYYVMGLPLDLQDPPWLVWRMNGEVLPQKHGFPARILAPNCYGWLNPKQVVAIRLLDEAFELPWVEQLQEYADAAGLHADSDIVAETVQIQAVVVQPKSMQFVEKGTAIRILGKAFGGSDPVVAVEISEDGGETYKEAELTYAPGADRWTLWRHYWRPEQAGSHLLHVRARSASGVKTQADHPENKIPYAGGTWILVEVI